MKHLLVVYSSQSGRTEALMRAALAGAATQAEAVTARCCRALDAGLDDLLWAQGLLLATPENFGYMSGALKDFLDRTYYPAQNRTNGLPYALIISAGNDGSGAVRAIERIAIGYGWKAITEPIIVRGSMPDATQQDIPADALQRCHELGEGFAAGLAAGVF